MPTEMTFLHFPQEPIGTRVVGKRAGSLKRVDTVFQLYTEHEKYWFHPPKCNTQKQILTNNFA
jgi:hypothetical protein